MLCNGTISFTDSPKNENYVLFAVNGPPPKSTNVKVDNFPLLNAWNDYIQTASLRHGVPHELIKAICVAESGMNPLAESHAGAKGLMQLMPITAKEVGVTDVWDPEQNINGGTEYIAKMISMFGDYKTALAAYNAGPGNVNKAIRRSGNKLTYWEVRPYLPKETQGYVPNFIAAAYLLTYHAEHNIIPAEANIKYAQLDTMCLSKGVHMQTIGDLIGMETEEIKNLNPIYKKEYIPYTIKGECISLPLQKIGQLVSLEDSLYKLELKRYYPETLEQESETSEEKQETTPSYSYHKVRSGENLSSIALRYGTTVDQIKKINGLTSNNIVVGQRLKVNPSQESSSSRAPQTGSSKRYYTVKSGDTFGRIAQRNRMSISQLKRLNPGINIDRLSIGQKIRIR